MKNQVSKLCVESNPTPVRSWVEQAFANGVQAKHEPPTPEQTAAHDSLKTPVHRVVPRETPQPVVLLPKAFTSYCGRELYREIFGEKKVPHGTLLPQLALHGLEPCWSQFFMEVRSRRGFQELQSQVLRCLNGAQDVYPKVVLDRIRAVARRFRVVV